MAKSESDKQKKNALDFIKNFQKTNGLASVLSESKLSNIRDYISTGSYILNRVISGSYFKGWPNNRIMVIAGANSTGKTYVCLSTAREAQKKGWQVVYFDSENAVDADFARNIGVDPETMLHIPVKTISQFRNEAVKLMREWRANEATKDIPMIMFCDSIGNLSGTKEMNDVEASKDASDMGQRAKELRACARILTMECAENEVPLIATNHTYEQQNMMGAPTIKMGGGEGFAYATSGILILQKKVVNDDTGEKDSEGRKIVNKSGTIVIATSEKNRLVPFGSRGYAYIDFRKGLVPLYGLLDDALKYGLIEQSGAWYTVKGVEKKFREKELYTKEVWQPIIKELNEKVMADNKFSQYDDSAIPDFVLDEEEQKEVE
jgi:RecA/RadA recombinase